MAWRIVRQPNGRYARFSDVVDDFTHMHLTAGEAIELCKDYMGSEKAYEKVSHGMDPKNAGRWAKELDQIEGQHGKKVRRRREQEGARLFESDGSPPEAKLIQ